MKKSKCLGYSESYTCTTPPLPGSQYCSYCKGRKFELEVCEVFKELGGKPTHNITVDGSQCDILVEFEEKLGRTGCYVECKATAVSTGVNTVNEFFNAFQTAARTRNFNRGMIVSESGFTADAKAKAESLGIICYTFDELRERRADFGPYLRTLIAEYEESAFYKRKYYLALQATLESSNTTRLLGELLEDFCRDTIPGPLLVIFADFGAGKTTTLRRFFWTQAKKLLAEPRIPLKPRIPILVNLRDFHLTMDLSKTLIGMLIDEHGLKLDGLRTFRQLNREGRLIILLDAFDEMVARAGPEYLIPAFQQFEKILSPSSKVVLTVRTHFLRDAGHLADIARGSVVQEYAKEKGYPIAVIQPLSTDQIQEYLKHIAPEGAHAVLGDRRLKQLATRPILLDMVAETLPELMNLPRPPISADLYRLYTDQWLDRDDWRCKMTHGSRRFFSENLAYHFYKQNVTSVHYKELPLIIQRHFPQIEKYRDLEYFDVDVRTSAFLSRDAVGNYSFTHKSFYEYFVASKVIGDAFREGIIETANRYPTEILDFLEDIVRAEMGQWPPDKCQQVLRLIYEIFCSNDKTIVAARTDSHREESSRPSDFAVRDATDKVIKHVLGLFAECRRPDLSLMLFQYRPRKIFGAVEIASSVTNWAPVPMRRLPGWMDRFALLFVAPHGNYEYKYLEDNAWEPQPNRQITLDSEPATLVCKDEHFGHVW